MGQNITLTRQFGPKPHQNSSKRVLKCPKRAQISPKIAQMDQNFAYTRSFGPKSHQYWLKWAQSVPKKIKPLQIRPNLRPYSPKYARSVLKGLKPRPTEPKSQIFRNSIIVEIPDKL